jgi:hypothetical protein
MRTSRLRIRMKPRQSIIERFSTFIQLADDLFDRWVTDSSLQRNV